MSGQTYLQGLSGKVGRACGGCWGPPGPEAGPRPSPAPCLLARQPVSPSLLLKEAVSTRCVPFLWSWLVTSSSTRAIGRAGFRGEGGGGRSRRPPPHRALGVPRQLSPPPPGPGPRPGLSLRTRTGSCLIPNSQDWAVGGGPPGKEQHADPVSLRGRRAGGAWRGAQAPAYGPSHVCVRSPECRVSWGGPAGGGCSPGSSPGSALGQTLGRTRSVGEDSARSGHSPGHRLEGVHGAGPQPAAPAPSPPFPAAAP